MNLDKVYVCDIEAKGFLDKIHDFSDIHVMSIGYQTPEGWKVMSTNEKAVMQKLLGNPENTVVFHYGINFDKPALEKVGIEFRAEIIDTIPLSYYLSSHRGSHGLADWGESFGVPKPVVEDGEWEGIGAKKEEYIANYERVGPSDNIFTKKLYKNYKEEKQAHYDKMAHRCQEDVKINIHLWVKFLKRLRDLYDSDEDIIRIIKYCNFKMETLRMQEENPIKVDMELCHKNIGILEAIVDEKKGELIKAMPQVPKKAKRTKPKSMYKKAATKPAKMFTKAGDLTSAGEKWVALLEEHGLDSEHEGPVEQLSASGTKWKTLLSTIPDLTEEQKEEIQELTEITGYNEPNPGSSKQVKDWLFTLGWQPCTFKTSASTGEEVPQLNDEEKNLTESVLVLAKKVPAVEILAGLSVAAHRLGVIKGFRDSADENGYIVARANKFTRTFRLAHAKPIVNLPNNTGTHGELVRICLVSEEGSFWANADLDSLEDRCKFIQVKDFADPSYFEKPEGHDPHLEIAVMAEFMTEGESDLFKWYKKKPKVESEMRVWGDNCPMPEYSPVAQDSCVPVDNTKIYTDSGWKSYEELELNQMVLTYNHETGGTEMQPILAIHFFEEQEITRMYNKVWDFESTADHRWLLEDGTFKTTSEIGPGDIIRHCDTDRPMSAFNLKKEVVRATDVFCISVKNENFIMKQKGRVTITGNCSPTDRQAKLVAKIVALADLRAIGKKTNYSCIYGVGPATLSKSTGLTNKKAKSLIEAYWKIHAPVKRYTETLITKVVDDKTWVYSPFTKFWLEIKGDHNKFSAVTQQFGAFVNDRMMFFMMSHGIKIIAGIHDESSWYCPVGDEDKHQEIIKMVMDKVNESFGYDIKFGSEAEFATSYGLVH